MAGFWKSQRAACHCRGVVWCCTAPETSRAHTGKLQQGLRHLKIANITFVSSVGEHMPGITGILRSREGSSRTNHNTYFLAIDHLLSGEAGQVQLDRIPTDAANSDGMGEAFVPRERISTKPEKQRQK